MPAASQRSKGRPRLAPVVPAEPRARILLVDDDERNLLAMSEVLSSLAEIVTVTSGRDALRELLKTDFAVILLDVFMPDMDGYETAALIRAREQTARIPIIFLSAVNKETEHLMRGYAMGAVDYVFKPVDAIVLRSKVAVFVDLYLMRGQIEQQARAEQALLEANLKAETERLALDRELQQSQLRQAAILESLPLALFEGKSDREGRLTRRFVGGDVAKFAGPAAAALLSGEQAWEQGIPREDRAGISRQYRLIGNSRASVQYRWTGGDGQTVHVLEQAVRLTEHEWIGTLFDVTEQRNLEEQLVQARKMDALGQLTGGVAHDFNNLLAAVLGGLDLFERRLELGEREKQIAMHMRHAADRGVELVRRLMTFARKQTLTPVEIDPAELVDSITGLTAHTFGHDLEVEWRVDAGALHIFADRSQLELALMNLLINARDAMPSGGRIDVVISLAKSGEEGNEALSIAVHDAGSGIPADIVAKVTEPFFTTKPAGKGTGLGLSMVAGFVQQSGGEMRIVSDEGRGTTIELVLPAVRFARKPRASSEAMLALPRASVRRLLLVDDEEGVRFVVGEQLKELGIEVTTAADADEALSHLEHDCQFDFVLTDLSMPGLDGAQLLARVRQKWPRLPAAIMTGNPKQLDTIEGPRGSVRVIQKPLSLSDLQDVLASEH
ncbi:MAG: response regulator [Croceibacterium sp.]